MRRVREDLVDLLLVEGDHPAKIALDLEPRSELEQRRAKVHDLLARRVEADCVVDGGADDARGARSLRLIGRLSLEKELAFAGDAHPKAGGRAVRLAVIDDPAPVRRSVRVQHDFRAAGAPRK